MVFSYILAILLLLTAYMYRNIFYWRKRGVHQITPFTFVGNFFDYWLNNKSPGDIIKDFYNQYKNLPYLGIYTFDTPCLLLIDPEIIKSILVQNFSDFSDKFMKSSSKDPLSNRSLPFLSYNAWSIMRRKLSPAFSPGKIKSDFQYLKQITEDLDHHLNSLGLELGKTINIKEICGKYTTDLIGLIGFGLKLNSLKDDNSEFRKYGKIMFGDYNLSRSYELTTIYLAPGYIKNLFDCRFFEKKSAEYFRKAFENIFKIREESGIIRNDLVDLLLDIKKEDSDLTLNDIIAQAIVLFTAGFDTTSTLMSFTLFELASNINVQEKLREEINKNLEKTGGKITYEMVNSLSFLENVISETLRLHPTVPTIDRLATKDFVIQETGLLVKKGTPIFISLTGLHYDKNYFPNPTVFDPENFLKSNGAKNKAYMPFGIGPRSCLALRQGLIQVKYGITHIISKYKVSLSESTCVQVDPKVYFTSGKEGLYLNVKKIDSEIN